MSFIDGHKLHQTKKDLEKQKTFTNDLCRERGLSVAEKGHHFDGSAIEQGEITAWNKDKYNLIINESKKSFVADCAIAILEVVPQSGSRDEFISGMKERGWTVQWEDNRKHIVFRNVSGDKVRDTNIEKTSAGIKANKEDLIHEFERQNERRSQANAEESGRSETDRASYLRELTAEISDRRAENRTVIDTENKSIFDAKQRRLEEQLRAYDKDRDRQLKRTKQAFRGPDL